MPLYRINISRTFRGASTLRCYLHIRIYKTLVKSQNNKRTRKKKRHISHHTYRLFSLPTSYSRIHLVKPRHVKTTPSLSQHARCARNHTENSCTYGVGLPTPYSFILLLFALHFQPSPVPLFLMSRQ